MKLLALWITTGRTMRFWLLGLLLTICVGAGAYIAAAYAGFTLSPTQQLDNEFLTCMDTGEQLQAVSCVHAQEDKWFARYGTALVVSELDKYQERFGSDFTCHVVGHEIGETLLRLNHNDIFKSLSECTLSCFSSCLHGVLIESAASTTVQQLLTLYGTSNCNMQSNPLCVHGMGHAFTIKENYNIAQALADCNKLPADKPSLAQCYSGVYMELFLAGKGLAHGEVATSTYSKPGDIFYPCDAPPASTNSTYASICYIQIAPQISIYAKIHGESVFALCGTAPKGWVASCVRGMGVLLATDESPQPKVIIQSCNQEPMPSLKQQCIAGAYVFLKYSGTKGADIATQLCALLPAAEKTTICTDPYKTDKNWFTSIPTSH